MVAYLDIKTMHLLREQKYSFAEIGAALGFSGERVRQTLKKYKSGAVPVRRYKPRYTTIRVRRVRKVIILPKRVEKPLSRIDRKLVAHLQGRDRNRELIRIRDGHKCQSCGKRWKPDKRRLDVHHLGGLCGKKSTGYDRLENIELLITLCHKCHYNHHEHSRFFPQAKQIEIN